MQNKAININKLISVNDALNFLLVNAKIPTKNINKTLDEALGSILAVDITANINVPEFDNSAMDGFAVAIDKNNNPPFKLQIIDRISAGSVGSKLTNNCAARIFTGAPTPIGAFAVVPQEECTVDNDTVIINRKINPQENIRPQADDIKKGEVIIKQGTKLKPQDIALIASIGIAKIAVFPKLTVGVFFTGNELLEPGVKLSAGKIYNSNRYSIVALLKGLDCNIINLGNIADDFDKTCQTLDNLSKKCDLIITTGGVSVGEEDHIKPAVAQLGTLDLWRIRVKPGKPLAFGNVNNTAFIGLPGNPVSAVMTFVLFAAPFIRKMQGRKEITNKNMPVQINFNWSKTKRREFVRVQLNYNTIPPSATLYNKQGSNVLSSLVWADGVVEMPEDSEFSTGDILNFYNINDLMQ